MTRATVLVNLVPIGAGGGLQNGLSFLEQLPSIPEFLGQAVIVCVRDSPIHSQCMKLNIPCEPVAGGRFGRLLFETFYSNQLLRKYGSTLVFTLFGNTPFACRDAYSISGFAYSNIIDDSIDFWGFLSPAKKLIKKGKDRLRLYLARLSNEIVVETAYLKRRAEQGVFSDKTVHVVEMEPSSFILNTAGDGDVSSDVEPFVDLLYLAGPHPNKRIHLLAPIVANLNSRSISDMTKREYRLVTTLPEGSAFLRTVQDAFSGLGIENCLLNKGPVAPDRVGELIRSCDAMINIAALESFSNNWVEAWAFRRPLISTDAQWARESCGDAAVYIDPQNATDAAERIANSLESDARLRSLTRSGEEQLHHLQSAGRKIEKYFQLVQAGLTRIELKT